MIFRLRKQLPAVSADAVAYFATLWGAFGLWSLFGLSPFEGGQWAPHVYGTLVLIGLAVQTVVFLWEGVYTTKGSYLESAAANRILRGLLISPIILLLFSYMFQFVQISKPMLLTAIAMNLVINPVLRSLFGIHDLPDFSSRKRPKKKLIIVGNGVAGECLLRRVIETKSNSYEVVGFLDKSSERVGTQIKTNSKQVRGAVDILGTYDQAGPLFEDNRPDEIWINDLNMPSDQIENLITTCRTNDIDVSIVPSIGQYPAQSLEVEMLDFVPILRPRKVTKLPLYESVKRLIDLAAGLMIGILLLPVTIPIAIMIKRGSEGPVIFKQKRIGTNGKPFMLYKFRSMYTNTNPYGISPSDRTDKRITKIGRFLRKTSLDELPQILNVIKGDMSLVGPRPEMPFIVEQYTDLQRLRLAVKPGITGLWQLSLDRTMPIHENLDYDLYYIHNRSLLLDLTILWRTLFLAMRGI